MKVIFFPVKETQLKLLKIYQTALDHFHRQEPLLILVPDENALHFVDNLLWRYPENSFLPHNSGIEAVQDIIALTKEPVNVNQATALFNLCPHPAEIAGIHLIYELDDFTSKEKQEASQKRFATYRSAGYPITLA